MSVYQPAAVRPAPGAASRAALGLVWLVPLLVFGLLVAFVVVGRPLPPTKFVLAGGIALIGLLFLAVTRYDSAVFLGFLLMSFVWVQPGPPDVVFAVIFAVALATGSSTSGDCRSASRRCSRSSSS